VSNSERPHGLQPTRLLRPWNSPGKSTGVGCHCLLQLTSYDQTKDFEEVKRREEKPVSNLQESSWRSQCPTSQNPPCWHPPGLNTTCGRRNHPESGGLARDRGKLTSTIKPEPARHTAEQSSCLPGRPFAMKPLALSARVSAKLHFQVLDESPLSAPEGSSFLPQCCNVAV